MQCHWSWGFIGNVLLLRNTSSTKTTGLKKRLQISAVYGNFTKVLPLIWQWYTAVKNATWCTFNWGWKAVVPNIVSNCDPIWGKEWITVVVTLMPGCTPSMESSHWEFPVRTGWLGYKLGAWPPRVFFFFSFFCPHNWPTNVWEIYTCDLPKRQECALSHILHHFFSRLQLWHQTGGYMLW